MFLGWHFLLHLRITFCFVYFSHLLHKLNRTLNSKIFLIMSILIYIFCTILHFKLYLINKSSTISNVYEAEQTTLQTIKLRDN